MDNDSDLEFGQMVVEQGLASPAQVQECLRALSELAALGARPLPTLRDVLLRKGYLEDTKSGDTMPTPVTRPAPASRPMEVPMPEEAVTAAMDPARVAGKYVRVRLLGSGGGGEVWKAWDRELGRWVALKFLKGKDEAEVERFRREAKTAARLVHPNIAAIYEAGEGYIAMQFVEGETLSKVSKCNPRVAAGLVRQAALAVHFAHEQGVIHRDLKPANLMLQSDRVYVLDFGLAKATEVDSSLSASGTAVGTPSYMSPEQAQGRKEVDRRSDVYSLGATLYELLAGRPPFKNANVYQTMKDVVEREPESIRGVARDLHTIVLKCLEKDPVRRYATAKDLADELQRYLDGEAIVARPLSTAARVWRKTVKHRTIVLSALAVVLVGAAITISLTRRNREVADRLTEQTRREEERSRRLEEVMRKSQLASKVLRRWSRLEDVLRKLEALFTDSRLPIEQVRVRAEEHRAAIEEFERETPDDPASQATMKALAAWAHFLSGYEDRAIEEMRAATAIDPDLPYGRLAEAMILYARYVTAHKLPGILVEGGNVGFAEEEPETAEMADLRGRIEACLEPLGESKVWGKESADDFRSAIAGLRAMQRGEYEAAERELTKALAAPDLRMFESWLFLARAEARYMRKAFGGALADLEELGKRRPASAELHERIGLVRTAEGNLEKAVESFTESLRLDPNFQGAANHRGIAYATLGLREPNDPRELYRKAIEDFTRVGTPDAMCNRGNVWLNVAMWAAKRGVLDLDSMARAVADYGEVLTREPTHFVARLNRADAYMNWGLLDLAQKQDPKGHFTLGLKDLDALIETRPGDAKLLYKRAVLHLRRGDAQANGSAEQMQDLDAAERDYEAASRAKPQDQNARYGLVLVCTRKAEADFRKGLPFLDRAMELIDAIETSEPGYAHLANLRAAAWWTRGRCQEVLGKKAEAITAYEKALTFVPAHAGSLEGLRRLQ